MTAPVHISQQPDATPVGHQGARVEIHERPARSTSGWLGVVVVLACIVRCHRPRVHAGPRSHRHPDRDRTSGGGLAGDRATRADPRCSVLRTLCRYGPHARAVVGAAIDGAAQRECSSPKLRNESSQGQRRRRQPGGDRRDRRMAGRRHCPGRICRGGLPELRSGPSRICARHVATTHPSTTRQSMAPPFGAQRT